jgi:hypothetical protein
MGSIALGDSPPLAIGDPEICVGSERRVPEPSEL